ncbi:hypothetical protein AYO40_03475 [Planctomycetaceae bacterium SCGC AG-212-D15]|nr:hypothetical protein AYO40_03475 [Planctomycetaceae bacterium SCGC AG-212-D15]
MAFPELCVGLGLPEPVPEYQFAKCIGRKWRMDWCWVREKVYLECDGGVWIQGRHTRGAGYIKDIEKHNEAAIMGYRRLTVVPQQMKSGEVFDILQRMFK